MTDSSVLFMYHNPDRSWISDPDPDHPKGTQPYGSQEVVSVKRLYSGKWKVAS